LLTKIRLFERDEPAKVRLKIALAGRLTFIWKCLRRSG